MPRPSPDPHRALVRVVSVMVCVAACAANPAAPEDDPPAPAQDDARQGPPPRGSDAAADAAAAVDAGVVDTPAMDSRAPGPDAGPDVAAPASPRVAISELMYHPVLEDRAEDEHEFIELHNPGTTAVDLTGWKLAGDVRFTFAGTTLAPGGWVVVARRRARLAEAGYALAGVTVVGDYEGVLDNGGGTVAVVDAKGAEVDRVRYDTDAPWPISADGLGASERWLAGEAVPLTKHRFGGRSLERISFSVPATDPRNWEASALGKPTPGAMNSVAGEPGAVVLRHAAARAAGAGPITAADDVRVTAQLSAGAVADVALEWFADAIDRADETPSRVPMEAAADGFAATIRAQPAGTIVRYRIAARTGGRPAGPISPRASDPFAWHAYHVAAADRPATRSYELYIAPRDWTRLWTNLSQGPNTGAGGCTKVPSWDARVPAVFVAGGQVYDVQVRHQGSRYQRRNGQTIARWTAPGPTQPSPLKALSWNISFPRWRRFEKKKGLNLNKMLQSCPGALNALEARLLWAAGTPSQRQRYARLYVNGAYYHYVMEVETVEEETMQAVEGAGNPVGDLFKSDGAGTDAEGGPWAFGGFTPLKPYCTYTALDRYRHTYERQSNDWRESDPKSHDELIALVDELAAARVAGPAALRAYFQKHWDVDQLATAFAIRNFAGVWDDVVHNFYLYKRPKDGKWIYIPQDFDYDWGGDQDTPDAFQRLFHWKPTTHFFLGEEGTPNGGAGGVNQLKSSFLKTFRAEFKEKLRALSTTVLAPDSVVAALDEEHAHFDLPSWMASPAPPSCNVPVRIAKAKTWIRERHAALLQFLATP